ncbi:DUF2252 family protein [Bdellovibrio bacteriovorus]|uniref:DUF2252 family protein n=1 Tax=Bdellovibrio TaxID=958 RepID=UPI0035A9A22F
MTKSLFKKILRRSYGLRLSSLLTVLALLAPGTSIAKNAMCSSLFTDSRYSQVLVIDGLWRKVPGDLFMGFRSNAPHYWNWLRSNKSPLLEVTGIVSGDPHIMNFGDVPLKKGGRDFALIDVDDAGVLAPLAGDFLRFFVSNQVSDFKVDSRQLFDAYLDGLNGKAMTKPSYLVAIEGKSDAQFREKQEKYLNKVSQDGKFTEKADLSPIESAPKEVRELFQRSTQVIENAMHDFTILDRGYKVKESGGSAGLPRFWFLLEKNGEKHVWEFKLESSPAIALYATQPQPLDRFNQVVSIYRPQEVVEGPYKFIQNGQDVFLVRERLSTYFDLEPGKTTDKKDLQDAHEMSLYIANQMGRWHGTQPNADKLLQRLEPSSSYEHFMSLSNDYIHLMKQENK